MFPILNDMFKADDNILQIHKTTLNHSRTFQGNVRGNKISFTNTVGVMIILQILNLIECYMGNSR